VTVHAALNQAQIRHPERHLAMRKSNTRTFSLAKDIVNNSAVNAASLCTPKAPSAGPK
jgi:hypothetical protein